jgi:AmmeMemoRadiSam system protein B/AmmeMemoRadiSam system protein A
MSTDTESVRSPAHAGTFYPAEPQALANMVDRCIREAPSFAVSSKAVVAPHAGFVYSGPIAGTAYRSIAARRGTVKRVVLMGPCHWHPTRTFAVPSARAFRTPLGDVPVDRTAVDALATHGLAAVDDLPHDREHSLEVHLPFLQRLLGDFALVPVAVGTPGVAETSDLLGRLWGGEETLIVVSSDLSHFHDYEGAMRLDQSASQAIETLRHDQLTDEQACGRYPVKGLLAQAALRDLRVTTLDLRNSGDTAGRDRRDRVVGYGAYGFEPAAEARLGLEDRRTLVHQAYRAVLGALAGQPVHAGDLSRYPATLRAHRATFVTLTMDGNLRGCIGTVMPQEPLLASVMRNAVRAATEDPRFNPPHPDEVRRMALSVSVLSHPRPMPCSGEEEALAMLRPGIDGIILEARGRRGLFLPDVWETLPEPRSFLGHLKRKAGLPQEGWPQDTRLYRFRTERFTGQAASPGSDGGASRAH